MQRSAIPWVVDGHAYFHIEWRHETPWIVILSHGDIRIERPLEDPRFAAHVAHGICVLITQRAPPSHLLVVIAFQRLNEMQHVFIELSHRERRALLAAADRLTPVSSPTLSPRADPDPSSPLLTPPAGPSPLASPRN